MPRAMAKENAARNTKIECQKERRVERQKGRPKRTLQRSKLMAKKKMEGNTKIKDETECRGEPDTDGTCQRRLRTKGKRMP